VKALEEHGFKVQARQSEDAAGWGSWPVRAGEMLGVLFRSES
jgi:hypothetical protein